MCISLCIIWYIKLKISVSFVTFRVTLIATIFTILKLYLLGKPKHDVHSAPKMTHIFSAMIIFGKSHNWIIKWDMIWKCSHWTTQIRFQNLSNSFELWAVSRQRGYPSKSKSQNRFSQLNVALQRSVKDYKLNKDTQWKNNHLAFQWYAL